MTKRIMALGLSLILAIGSLSIPAKRINAVTTDTVILGSGSVASDVTSDIAGIAQNLPTKDNSGTIRFTTENYNNTNGAFDTNNWGTSAMWNFNGGNKYSGSLYAYPLAFKADRTGMWISKPPTRTGSTYCVMTLPNTGAYTDWTVKPDFSSDCAKVDKITDWTYDVVMENQNNPQQYMKTTMVQGSPYGFFRLYGTDSVNVTRYQRKGESTKALLKSEIIYKNTADLSNATYIVLKVYDDMDEKNGYSKYDYYGLYVPKGTVITQSGNSSDNVGNLRLKFTSDENAYFSMAWLCESNGSDTEALNIAANYEKYAYNFVTDTYSDYSYDEESATLTTTYRYKVEKMAESKTDGTIMGILPHQYKNMSARNYLSNTARTLRGTVKYTVGSSFTTELKYSSVLPYMPGIADGNKSQLSEYVQEYMKKHMPEGAVYSLCVDETAGDPYALGKQLNRAANVMSAAEDVGDENSSNKILNAMKKELSNWFSYSGSGDGKYFAYSKGIGSLLSFPSSYNSIDQMNDHHFHYGYFIQAAAQVGMRDLEWMEKYGAVIEELIDDIACTKRNSKDSRYPYLRNFAPFEGHSWASGFEDPESGNNQESTSEAMNAWYGIILYGEASGNKEIRDLGIYLYTTELSAINTYWFDQDKDVLDNKYVYQGGSSVKNNLASLVWSGKYDYGTWFSGNAAHIQGIQLMPVTAGSFYLASDKQYIKDSVRTIESKGVSGIWNDVWSAYYALATPELAEKYWSKGEPEAGESRAHTYMYIKSLEKIGTPDTSITSNTVLSAVFVDNNGKKNYAVYNASNKLKNVIFSDGAKFSAPANEMTIINQNELEGEEYYIENYLQNKDGTYTLDNTEVKYGEIGQSVAGKSQDIPGYQVNKEKSILNIVLSPDNKTLKIYYDIAQYTIHYELNGGVQNPDNIMTYQYGESFNFYAPTKEGYNFGGWYEDNSFTKKIGLIDEKTYGNLTLYAKWVNKNDTYINDNLYMALDKNLNATFVAQGVSADNIIVLYKIFDNYESALREKESPNSAGYIGYNMTVSDGIWTTKQSLKSYENQYIVFMFNLVGAGGDSGKAIKKISADTSLEPETTKVITPETSTAQGEDDDKLDWQRVNNSSYEYAVSKGNKSDIISVIYQKYGGENVVTVSCYLAAVFQSVTINGEALAPEAGATVKIPESKLQKRFNTLKVVDFHGTNEVTVIIKNNKIEEDTTKEETSEVVTEELTTKTDVEESTTKTDVEESTTEKEKAIVEVNGSQINTTIGGHRVVYSIYDPNDEIENSGLIYGVDKYITDENLTVDNNNIFVQAFQSSAAGKSPVSFSTYPDGTSYMMTMKFIYSADYYNTGMKVRAYAKLKNGQYIYSDIESYTIFDIADILYQKNKMSTVSGHEYLYNNILSVVDADYKEVEYNWNNTIVK